MSDIDLESEDGVPLIGETAGAVGNESARVMQFVQAAVLGASDGGTVPFALAASLANRTGSTSVVLAAVVSELAAGCVAMGLGGYLAAAAEEAYIATRVRRLVRDPRLDELVKLAQPAHGDARAAAEFVVRNERVGAGSKVGAALTVGSAYVLAGAIPAIPYLVASNAQTGLRASILVGGGCLLAFGWLKGTLLGGSRRAHALQTLSLGALAAVASYMLASFVK